MWATTCGGSSRAALTSDAGGVAVEVAVDLAKAYENVRRDVLFREAESMVYPADAILTSLGMYAMNRRLVYRGCVGKDMYPNRGIGAGSAFATRELLRDHGEVYGKAAEHVPVCDLECASRRRGGHRV